MTADTPTLRVVTMPKDTNAMGSIFGGVILSYIDLAGVQEARKHARHEFVTVAMEKVEFKQPVHVGDLVSCYTTTERLGRTSVTIKVRVTAVGWMEARDNEVDVTEATVTFVAVDGNRRPVPILG